MNFDHPRLIQGGMGIGVSGWKLAKAVSRTGQLGTVSITAVWIVLTRTLQLGDEGGHIRRALAHFPNQDVAARVLNTYFIEGGKDEDAPFRTSPMMTHPMSRTMNELLVVASFVEVWLAKENHDGKIAVNGLEKIQLAHLPSLYGAMLAGVDYVLMGAGIPLQIMDVLETLSTHAPVSYRLAVEGALSDDTFEEHFSPLEIVPQENPQPLKRPFFFPIISSHVLAQMFTKHGNKRADGFIIEGATAGGHNAPPRNKNALSETGEPIYTEKDQADLSKMPPDVPYWLAGSFASPDALPDALAAGAQGIQAGSIFALCEESSLSEPLKKQTIEAARRGELTVRTNPTGSPSGFPFKEAQIPGTLTDIQMYDERPRVCDIGALRSMYRREDGKIGFRCSAEPVEQYLKKGGDIEDTVGRRCLCNTLSATIDLGQVRPQWDDLGVEPPLVTLGDNIEFVHDLTTGEPYSAAQAVDYLMQKAPVL